MSATAVMTIAQEATGHVTVPAVEHVRVTVVDVVSDLTCPWCWVGKRNLEEAVRRLPKDAQVVVRWHPYQIRPDVPKEGTPRRPATAGSPRVGDRLRSAAAAVGIDFTDRSDRTPNTLAGHTLLQYAAVKAGPSKQNEVQEVLFRQYFTDGVFLDSQALRAAAEEVGLPTDEAMAFTEDRANQATVAKEAWDIRESGIQSVPLFCINGVPIFNGLHTTDNFLKVLEMARDR